MPLLVTRLREYEESESGEYEESESGEYEESSESQDQYADPQVCFADESGRASKGIRYEARSSMAALPYLPADYQVLGCDSTVSFQQLKACWHRLALLLHPDKGGNNAAFQKLNESWVGVAQAGCCRGGYYPIRPYPTACRKGSRRDTPLPSQVALAGLSSQQALIVHAHGCNPAGKGTGWHWSRHRALAGKGTGWHWSRHRALAQLAGFAAPPWANVV